MVRTGTGAQFNVAPPARFGPRPWWQLVRTGLNLLPWTVVIALVGIGTISMTLYVIQARRTASPVLDFGLLRLPTMRASIIGGFLFRLGIGALPFLLPLLMQVGFGLSPVKSGLVTFASAVGAMGMKTLAARIIKTFGFRNIMVINAVVSSIFLAACALFTEATPLLLMSYLNPLLSYGLAALAAKAAAVGVWSMA